MKKKAKTKGVKYWKKKAWEEFSKFVRIRDAIGTTGTKTHLVCISCGKTYPAFGVGCAQAGHFVSGRSHSLLFREKGVHGQCYNCNQTLKGNWPEYYTAMLAVHGRAVLDLEIAAKYLTVKYTASEMESIRDEYKKKYEELLNR